MPTFAAIDIGSNSVRLKISRLQAGRLKEIHEDREVTRLGDGVFNGGLLSPQAMSETVQVLQRFHRAMQECCTDSVRVVATAALRDARKSRGCSQRSFAGPRRWQLRAHAFARGTNPGYGELAAWSRAPDRRVSSARSTAQERVEAAPGICGAGNYAHSRSHQVRTRGCSNRHFGHSRCTGGRRQPPGAPQEAPAGDLCYPRDDSPHCQTDYALDVGTAAQGSRDRSAPR